MISLVVGGAALTMLVMASLDYFLLSAELNRVKANLEESTAKFTQLDSHLHALETNRLAKAKANLQNGLLEDQLLEQSEFKTDGLWVAKSPTQQGSIQAEGLALDVPKTHVELKGDRLNMIVRVQNLSNPPQDVGGYLCITMVNKDQFPVVYTSATGGDLGAEGFPVSYKSGVQFYVGPDKWRRVKYKYKLAAKDEYYTHMTLFLYSYRGTLLHKRSVPIKKEIFFE